SEAAEGTDLVASRIPANGLDHEECLRVGTLESLGALEPAFGAAAEHYRDILGRDIDHRHTIAHAPPISDGAALALVGAEGAVDTKPRAQIVACAEVGGDPAESLTAGFAAMGRVFEHSGLSLDDMDRIEFMEAFAVSIVKFMRDYEVSPEKVNVGGGHLAKGHPLGASGAILVSALLDALDAANGRYGIVVAAGASGIGSAMIVERMG
ncbi:MAG: acyl-CoA thiolase, partial [Gammaproteobacteria bacterium]